MIGFIYKIVIDFETNLYKIGEYYVGSTENIDKRMCSHRYENKWSYQIALRNGHAHHETILEFETEDKIQLKITENLLIDLQDPMCLNQCRSYRTYEELLEYDREYYETNKEQRKESSSTMINCVVCDGLYRRGDMSQHMKSKKCLTKSKFNKLN
jgi:hypothetical protein